MGRLRNDRNQTTNPDGSIHIVLEDSTAESGYRSYWIYVDDILAAVQLRVEKDIANGYAGLDSTGKINPIQLPAIAITNTYIVASQAAMLALSVTVGSVSIRTDESKSYILQSEPSSTLSNWKELQGVSGVGSFNGRTGTVTPQSGDYTLDQITETATRVTLTPALLAKLISLTGVDANAFHSDETGEINALTDIGTIADATVFLGEKTSLFGKVKVAWSLIKSTLKTYFDSIYAATLHTHSYEPVRGADQNYVTDINLAVLNQTSGTNTGNQFADQTTITGSGSLADPFVAVGFETSAEFTTVDITNFDNNLSSADDTVQKALETINSINILKTEYYEDLYPEDTLTIDLNTGHNYNIYLTENLELTFENLGQLDPGHIIVYQAASPYNFTLTVIPTPIISNDGGSEIVLNEGLNKITQLDYIHNGSYLVITVSHVSVIGGSGDMILGEVQTVTAEKIFNDTKLAIKGTGTNKTIFATAETGDGSGHTQTLQAKDGVLANTNDFRLEIACSDVATALTAGEKKATFIAPFDFTLTGVIGFLDTVCTGSTFIIDINKNATTVLSTKLSIDASENTSLTAATAAVISVSSFTKGDIISVDFDQVGATIAGAGCVIVLELTKL